MSFNSLYKVASYEWWFMYMRIHQLDTRRDTLPCWIDFVTSSDLQSLGEETSADHMIIRPCATNMTTNDLTLFVTE